MVYEFQNLHFVHDRTHKHTHTYTGKREWQLWVLCEMPRRRHLKKFFIHKISLTGKINRSQNGANRMFLCDFIVNRSAQIL